MKNYFAAVVVMCTWLVFGSSLLYTVRLGLNGNVVPAALLFVFWVPATAVLGFWSLGKVLDG